ncbi:MAG: ComF family protein [Pseudomonadota bacterium]
MKRFFLDLLFPINCMVCKKINVQNFLCNECWSKINFITKPACAICSHPFEYEEDLDAICGYCIREKPTYDKAISILKYDELSKIFIHNFKYKDHLHYLDYITKLMINLGKEVIQQADIIIPVPMHHYKLLKRGYNQAALLAIKIAESYPKLEYLPQLLIKKDNKSSQAGLTKEQRLKNIKNSFKIENSLKNKIKGKKILLVDDVITTGATMSECCRILKQNGAEKLFVLTLAKRV